MLQVSCTIVFWHSFMANFNPILTTPTQKQVINLVWLLCITSDHWGILLLSLVPRRPCENYAKAVWWLRSTFLAPEVITQQECLLVNQTVQLSNLHLCNQPRSTNQVQQATSKHGSLGTTRILYPLHCIPLRVPAAFEPFFSLKKHGQQVYGISSNLNTNHRLCIGKHLA